VSIASICDIVRQNPTKPDKMRANESTMRVESDQDASKRHASELYVNHDVIPIENVSGVVYRR
jgi:hypothetical protein